MNNNNSKNYNDSKSSGLISWFAENHVAANILMFLFIIGGIVSVISMRTETFPSIDPRRITVTVVYPGATPYEVAESITNRVEEALIGIEGVERITSTASEGAGTINVEIEDFADADEIYNDVETNVNSLIDFPPENAERPVITKLKVTPNVLTLALHGNVSEKIIKFWAENIEDEIRSLKGVALTKVRGVRDYQISIEIPENSLRKYSLTLADVASAINNFSADVPAGTIESSRGDILLRVQNKKYTGEEFKNIILKTLPNGSVLKIKDIGKVLDGFDDINLISKYNSEPAAFIDVLRSEAEDTIKIANIVKNYLSKVQLPQGLKLSLQKDETLILKDRISLMLRNAILGFMLVFLILLFFLDLKLAFWTSIAIPVSFLGGMMIIGSLGYSLNMISLFALIVVLGIVVDDAIIVGESIFEYQNKEPNSNSSVLDGVKSVIAPVTVGVTTTMAAFAPLIFSTGTFGQIVRIIPIVVIPILFVSLLEAYFILPAHLSNPSRWSKGIMAKIRNKFSDGLSYFTENFIVKIAKIAVSWRYVTVAIFVSLAIITAGMMKSGIIRFIFFPAIEGDRITIDITTPQGTPFETTEETILKIEEEILKIKSKLDQGNKESIFESIAVTIGEKGSGDSPMRAPSGNNGNNIGQIKIRLVPSDFRTYSAYEVESKIRENIEELPNIEELTFKSSLVGDEPDIEVELQHPEDDILIKSSEELKNSLKKIKGTKEVADSFEIGKTEYIFELTQEGLAAGLTPLELGRQLRYYFFGFEAQRIQRGKSEVIVYVRYPKTEREDIAILNEVRIRLPDNREIALKDAAKIESQIGYSQIQTVDGKRIVSVTADADTDITTPNEVMDEMRNNILPNLKQKFDGLTYSFEGESKEQKRDLDSLGKNMLIAILIIYILLGSQLRSYFQPIVIMSAIPFGFVGAVWGHYLLGYDLTFISMFGVVALSGVVVNDSVVLVDYFNKKVSEGNNVYDSSIIAISRRFRPILLTSLTTSLGLFPMLLETSVQARFLIPMVISLATGIIFATFVILLLVPSVLMISLDVKHLLDFSKTKVG